MFFFKCFLAFKNALYSAQPIWREIYRCGVLVVALHFTIDVCFQSDCPCDEVVKYLTKFYLILLIYKVIGQPSKTLMETMQAEEKQRVAEQQKELGEDGLAQKAKRLKTATDENEVITELS